MKASWKLIQAKCILLVKKCTHNLSNSLKLPETFQKLLQRQVIHTLAYLLYILRKSVVTEGYKKLPETSKSFKNYWNINVKRSLRSCECYHETYKSSGRFTCFWRYILMEGVLVEARLLNEIAHKGAAADNW